jgi:hypothetical protein
MTKGSTGQRVLHPGVAEARQQRQLMAALLGRLDIPEAIAHDARPEAGWRPAWAGARALDAELALQRGRQVPNTEERRRSGLGRCAPRGVAVPALMRAGRVGSTREEVEKCSRT